MPLYQSIYNPVVKFWQNKLQNSTVSWAHLVFENSQANWRGLQTCPFKITQMCQFKGKKMAIMNHIYIIICINIFSFITDTHGAGSFSRKNKSGLSGFSRLPANDNRNNTGSKWVWDSRDKSGLTPDEEVTKNIHGKDKSLTEIKNSMKSSVSNEKNDNLASLVCYAGYHMDSTGGGDSGGNQTSPGASPNKQTLLCPRKKSSDIKIITVSHAIMLTPIFHNDPQHH